MIVYRCRFCKRPLEVDDDLAGKQAACPHCRQIGEVPTHSQRADGVPIARPAGGTVDIGRSGDEEDRAAARGLPPDSGPEEHVLTVHPAPLRARPMHAAAILILILGGLTTAACAALAVLTSPFAFLGLAATVAGALWWAWYAISARSIALIITNKRTTERRGWLRKATKEILHDKVQDIQVTQSFPQRMIGIGTIGISNAGESGVEIEVHDIPSPHHIRETIDAYRELG